MEKQDEIYTFKDRPNQEDLVEQRKKYVKLAIDNFFNNPNLIKSAKEAMETKPGTFGEPIKDKTVMDAIAELVMAELKTRQGINEQSKDKTIEEFERSYPMQLIKQEILQDPRVVCWKDNKTIDFQIEGMGSFGHSL